MKPVILVLLAAGRGVRFGENKLLYPVDGMPMYRHAADLALELGPMARKKIVVTGYEEIGKELEAAGFEVVMNRRPELGISRSVRLAAEAADGTEGGICFLVCDQPWLTADTVRGLLEGWEQSGKGMGCLVFRNKPGNPAVFGEKYREELKTLTGDRGGRQIMNRFPSDVFFYEAPEERELQDVDTREILHSRSHKDRNSAGLL